MLVLLDQSPFLLHALFKLSLHLPPVGVQRMKLHLEERLRYGRNELTLRMQQMFMRVRK